MTKVLLQTLLGIVLLIGGFFLAYFGFLGINDGQAWFLIPAILIVGASSFLLFRAGKSDDSVVHKAKHNLEALSTDKPGLETTLEKNNSFDSEWGKTTEARNRLKMLQLSADAGKKS